MMNLFVLVVVISCVCVMHKLSRSIGAGILLLAVGGCEWLPLPWESDSGSDVAFDHYSDLCSGTLGYGVVNSWSQIDPNELADALALHGLEVTIIELLGGDSTAYEDPSIIAKPYQDFIHAMRKRKIVTIVCVANDNAGSGKYGSNTGPLSDYIAQLLQALQIVSDQGPEGVILQPVTEIQSDTGFWLEGQARAICPGFTFAYNPDHGDDISRYPFAYRIVHPATTQSSIPAYAINVTDNGSILAQLSNGDAMAPAFNPSSAYSYSRDMLYLDVPTIFYGFKHAQIDKASIEAIGRAKRDHNIGGIYK